MGWLGREGREERKRKKERKPQAQAQQKGLAQKHFIFVLLPNPA